MPYFSQSTTTLPEPSADAREHSEKLKKAISAQIQKEGVISFQSYMQMALYQSGLGYYLAGCAKFGEPGDFITAPEISPLFGQCVAKSISPYLKSLPEAHILEFGPGSGKLCVQVLKQLESLNALPEKYFLLEVSPDLIEKQKALIQQEIPQQLKRIEWLESLPQKPISGVILANEVLDALTLCRFKVIKQKAVEMGVSEADGKLSFTEYQKTPTAILNRAQQLAEEYQFPDGFEFEIQPELSLWIAALYQSLHQGFALLIDYGECEREAYRSENNRGSLRCFYQHHLVEDPFRYPGLQDITCDVNFTAVAEAAVDAGFKVSGYTNQALYLISSGLDQLIDMSLLSDEDRWRTSQAIQLLTSPNEMGERFKVMALNKNVEQNLDGFSMKDLRSAL